MASLGHTVRQSPIKDSRHQTSSPAPNRATSVKRKKKPSHEFPHTIYDLLMTNYELGIYKPKTHGPTGARQSTTSVFPQMTHDPLNSNSNSNSNNPIQINQSITWSLQASKLQPFLAALTSITLSFLSPKVATSTQ